jgi:hypothetical protein
MTLTKGEFNPGAREEQTRDPESFAARDNLNKTFLPLL